MRPPRLRPLRPDRLPGAPRVRDRARVRRRRALPRPGRQPRVSLGQQLLLPRRAALLDPWATAPWRDARAPGGGARRHAVPRQRPRPEQGRLHRGQRPGRRLAVRGHRARARRCVGSYGIEIDSRAPSSPPGTVVLAQIPDPMGPGRPAHMTYYETPAGARLRRRGLRLRQRTARAPRRPAAREPLGALHRHAARAAFPRRRG